MNFPHHNSKNIITKLTALWAVSESGLGGILHAMKLPFSGLILGSFAVIMVTFIAVNSKSKFRTILQATLIVILIKAIASPHSPFTAYVAVMFQGFLGALLYTIFDVNKFSAAIFGVIALLESALQKLLMMVFIFGENIWQAIQAFFNSLASQFHIQSLSMLPVTIVFLYGLVYSVVGFIVGIYAFRLPEIIKKEAEILQHQNVYENELSLKIPKKNKRKSKILGLFFVLLFMVTVFVFSGSINKAFYALLRTFAAVAFLYFVVAPLFKLVLERWKNTQKIKKEQRLNEVLQYIPEFRNYAETAFLYANHEKGFLKKIRKFIIFWMFFSLYSKD